jgi:hypothetical protein
MSSNSSSIPSFSQLSSDTIPNYVLKHFYSKLLTFLKHYIPDYVLKHFYCKLLTFLKHYIPNHVLKDFYSKLLTFLKHYIPNHVLKDFYFNIFQLSPNTIPNSIFLIISRSWKAWHNSKHSNEYRTLSIPPSMRNILKRGREGGGGERGGRKRRR